MSKNIKWLLACLIFVTVSACATKKIMVNMKACERIDGVPAHIVECEPVSDEVKEVLEP